jgi:hypothetical protein
MEQEKKVITHMKIIVNLNALKYVASDIAKIKLSKPEKYLPKPNAS